MSISNVHQTHDRIKLCYHLSYHVSGLNHLVRNGEAMAEGTLALQLNFSGNMIKSFK